MTKQNPTSCRFPLLAMLGILTVIGVEIAIPVSYILPRLQYATNRGRIIDKLERWKTTDSELERQWSTLQKAVEDVCQCSEVVPNQALTGLLSDLNRFDKKRRDGSTVEWLWRRLAATGAHGGTYVTRVRACSTR